MAAVERLLGDRAVLVRVVVNHDPPGTGAFAADRVEPAIPDPFLGVRIDQGQPVDSSLGGDVVARVPLQEAELDVEHALLDIDPLEPLAQPDGVVREASHPATVALDPDHVRSVQRDESLRVSMGVRVLERDPDVTVELGEYVPIRQQVDPFPLPQRQVRVR
jgi:hypothetical protein